MTTPPAIPKKDVIYVDIEDDITSIIDKVKSADSQIVALVPPKRIGVLQSVVNLKLLQRAAESTQKRVVLITSDHALSSLAAGASIPVARNLQTKPEVPEIAPVHTNDEEVIEGDAISDDEADTPAGIGAAASVAPTTAEAKRRTARSSRIPNFDAFRNRAALIVVAVVALVGFGLWAFLFAPKTTVTITAKTIPYSVNKPLTATPTSALSAESGTLSAVVKEVKRTATVDFTPTGKKDVGERAKGTVRFSTDSLSAIASGRGNIPAGTQLTHRASGLVYTTDSAVSLTLGSPSGSTGITATESGSDYNGASGAVNGAPSGIDASITGTTAGGTDREITVVSESDAAAAREKLPPQETEAIKSELQKQFANDVIVVDESFIASPGNPVVAPAVGEEASAAKLSVETTYTLVGFKRSDISAMLDFDLKRQLDGIPNQFIYDKGIDTVRFSNFRKEGEEFRVSVQSTGHVGPQINTAELATQLEGKREGEIIAQVKTYDGIESVSVDFSPFWVSRAPAADKIIIQFQVDNAGD